MSESTPQSPKPLTLRWLPETFAVARLEPGEAVPSWAAGAQCSFLSITRTADELSIIAPEDCVPEYATAERGFVALRIVGTLKFSEVGILARLTCALAAANISVVAVSTYDTDYLLVRADDQMRAEMALRTVAAVESK